MASRLAVDGVEESEVLLLLEEYCSKRSQQRSKRRLFMPCNNYPIHQQSAHGRREVEFRSGQTVPTYQCHGGELQKDESSDTTRTAVAGQLLQIAESAPIPEVDVKDQDEIIQKLVELMKTFGDDINNKIKQNMFLQQQLRTLNYDTFERLTSSVQSLVVPEGQASAASAAETASDRRIQQQRIAWAFEVTSRLSAIDFVHKRRVLSFAGQYIQQHHNAWLQQHGGWEEVFDVENVD